MPGVTDDDWLVRLRKHLGIKFQKVEKIPPSEPVKPKPELDLPLASASCPHPAGSVEKIEVMRRRAERGQAIFHPGDNRDILVRQSHCARVG